MSEAVPLLARTGNIMGDMHSAFYSRSHVISGQAHEKSTWLLSVVTRVIYECHLTPYHAETVLQLCLKRSVPNASEPMGKTPELSKNGVLARKMQHVGELSCISSSSAICTVVRINFKGVSRISATSSSLICSLLICTHHLSGQLAHI